MKVIVLGGTGVFGSRLVTLLHRVGHNVRIASWSGGAGRIKIDRNGDLAALFASPVDVIVDAAGPFHAYGDDPYRLPKACIANGVHYLDLADDAAFCAGISVLDAAAQKAGVFVLSGVSSVPAVSSAIAADLLTDCTTVDSIEAAILPGNRAPRGRAVVESILSQTGTLQTEQIDGVPQTYRSWSDPMSYEFAKGFRRRAWLIGVPDQALLPAFFLARTVRFRAGVELAVMNYGLAALSALRVLRPKWLVAGVFHLSRLLAPFGTDVGGMVVTVVGQWPDGWQRRSWR